MRKKKQAKTVAERVTKWRLQNPAWRKRDREKRFELKKEVLAHYGNDKLACVICGGDRMACLSIDHIAGGGNKQRKGNLRASDSFYRWLKTSEYPKGYQTLCMNCQFVKRFENREDRPGYKSIIELKQMGVTWYAPDE